MQFGKTGSQKYNRVGLKPWGRYYTVQKISNGLTYLHGNIEHFRLQYDEYEMPLIWVFQQEPTYQQESLQRSRKEWFDQSRDLNSIKTLSADVKKKVSETNPKIKAIFRLFQRTREKQRNLYVLYIFRKTNLFRYYLFS